MSARRSLLARAAILALSPLLGSCDDRATIAPAVQKQPTAEWPIYRGDRSLHGVATGAIPDALVLRWTYEAGKSIASSPVVAGGVVFVGADDNGVHAVDFETGARRWRFETGDVVEAPPLVHEATVYVGSSDAFVYAIDAEAGTLRWRHETGDRVLGSANWAKLPDGRTVILVGSYDNRLHCLDAADGSTVWTYETANYVNGAPAIARDRAIFGGCDAIVHVVSIATGEAVEQVALGDECYIAGSVATDGDEVYFGHYGNAFVCVDLAAGAVRWEYASGSEPFFSSPALGSDRVVFGGRDRILHCVARADGRPIWTARTRRKIDGSPVICGDKVVFGSGDGTLSIARLDDGAITWTYDIGEPVYSSPAVCGGAIVIGAGDGKLYSFGAALETRSDS